VLAEAIFVESLHHIEAGANPIALQRGIVKGGRGGPEGPREVGQARRGQGRHRARGDRRRGQRPEIGKIIADAIDMVGKDGAVTVEEAKGMDTKITADRGPAVRQGLHVALLREPAREAHVRARQAPHPRHEKKDLQREQPDPDPREGGPDQAAAAPHRRRARGGGPGAARREPDAGRVRLLRGEGPGFGDRRKELLEDVAVFTGAKAILEDIGVTLEDVQVKDLGTAKRVIIEKEADHDHRRRRLRRGDQGPHPADQERDPARGSDYDREKLQERLSKLSGGLAQINVGAATEVEMKQKRARLEDALHAARAAIEEGVLPGGGVALLRSRRAIDALKLSGDEKIGAQILRRALEVPIRQIADNAGARGSVVVQKIDESKDYPSASTPRRASTRTSSRPASSIRARWCAWPSRTRPAWRHLHDHRGGDHGEAGAEGGRQHPVGHGRRPQPRHAPDARHDARHGGMGGMGGMGM
jgi:chaperonin GroEL